jgi:hypothetical protein
MLYCVLYNIQQGGFIMGITKEQIYSIADSLNKEGIKPTLAAVRRRLGAGSFTTISEALNEWKIIKSSVAVEQQEVVPDILMERLHQFGAALWAEALNTATKRFSQEHEAMEKQFKEKENYYNELESAKACIEELRGELTATGKKYNAKEKEALLVQQNLAKVEAEYQMITQRNIELQQELARSYEMSDKLQKNLITALISNFEELNKRSIKNNVSKEGITV